MRTRKPWLLLGLLLLLLPLFATPADAADDSPWSTDLYLNIWGIGIGAEYGGLTLLDGVRTGLDVSLCATYEDWGFYDPPSSDSDLGVYKRMNYVWSLGVRQGLLADSADGGNLAEFFLYYKGLSDRNLRGDSPAGSLVFDSGLPDSEGILQHSFLVGAAYDTITEDADTWASRGYRAEASFETAPGGLNDTADFQRLNVTLKGFWPLVESDGFNLLLADRFIYDSLTGDYVPINARTTFGGLSDFPGRQIPGMGDGLRGIQIGRFDGDLKILNNFEVRATFPELFGEWIMLGLVAYCDLGVSDLRTGDLDWGNLYSTVGIGAGLHTKFNFDLIVYADYFVPEDQLTASVEMGMHF